MPLQAACMPLPTQRRRRPPASTRLFSPTLPLETACMPLLGADAAARSGMRATSRRSAGVANRHQCDFFASVAGSSGMHGGYESRRCRFEWQCCRLKRHACDLPTLRQRRRPASMRLFSPSLPLRAACMRVASRDAAALNGNAAASSGTHATFRRSTRVTHRHPCDFFRHRCRFERHACRFGSRGDAAWNADGAA